MTLIARSFLSGRYLHDRKQKTTADPAKPPVLGMNVPAVFKAKSRVFGYIRHEIERLERGP
jgi:hypothetical protein